MAEAFRPDVVLLDIGMPKLNGYEAAARIREQPWGKDMVLIALTGWGQDEDQRRSHGGRVRPPPGQAGRPRQPRDPAGRVAGNTGVSSSSVVRDGKEEMA